MHSQDNIVTEIATEAGVAVNVDAGIDQTAIFTVPMSGLNTYQALQAVAQAVGGYAVDTYTGEIDLKLFDDTPTLSVDAGLMTSLPQVEEIDYSITGVAIYTAGGVIKSATPINYSGEAHWLTLDMFSDYESALVGYTYRPATIDLSLGDPRLEGNDVLTVTDADLNTYTVPCHSIIHSYDGGFMSQIVGAEAQNVDNDVATPAPLTDKINDLQEQINNIEVEESEYFWHTTTDTGAGAGSHITQIPQQEFLARVAIDPTDGGGNTLIDSDGLKIRDGLTTLAKFNNTQADGVVVTIGLDDGSQSYIYEDYHSLQMIDKNGYTYFYVSDLRDRSGVVEITSNFTGDGTTTEFFLSPRASNTNYDVYVDDVLVTSGITKSEFLFRFTTAPADQAQISVTYNSTSRYAKAYSFGLRKASSLIGLMSVIEGYDTTASGQYSHAEGYGTTGSGHCSHAEGDGTTASGYCSHAEGYDTTASGEYSHAEGYGTTASGDYSHAEGYGTVANYAYQTVVGRNNDNQADSLFEIGRGATSNNRSNAFTVNTDGKTTAYPANTNEIGFEIIQNQTGVGALVRMVKPNDSNIQGWVGISAGNNFGLYWFPDGVNGSYVINGRASNGGVYIKNNNNIRVDVTEMIDLGWNTGTDGSALTAERWGKVVTLHIVNPTKLAVGTNVVATLPAGWRPASQCHLPLIHPIGTITTGDDLSLRATIGTNGVISIYNYRSTAISGTTNASGTLSFVTA